MLIQGSPAKNWWLRQEQDTQFKVVNQIHIGASLDLTVDGLMAALKQLQQMGMGSVGVMLADGNPIRNLVNADYWPSG